LEELEVRRERLYIAVIHREMLMSLVENFERFIAEGFSPNEEHLLRQLVKTDCHTAAIFHVT
jgi:hypothetical protein